MEIPSPFAGTIKAVKIKIGDKVSEGSLLITLEVSEDSSAADDKKDEAPAEATPPAKKKLSNQNQHQNRQHLALLQQLT